MNEQLNEWLRLDLTRKLGKSIAIRQKELLRENACHAAASAIKGPSEFLLGQLSILNELTYLHEWMVNLEEERKNGEV
jgi:hypothetical protein